MPHRFCFEISNDPAGLNQTGVMDYSATRPTYIPYVTQVDAVGLESWLWQTACSGLGIGSDPSLGGGWYSGISYYQTCTYNADWDSYNGFNHYPTNFTSIDNYYYMFHLPEDGVGSFYPYLNVYMFMWVQRSASIHQTGTGFGGIPFDVTYTRNLTLYDGNLDWHLNPTSTPITCTDFSCSGVPRSAGYSSEVYLQGFGFYSGAVQPDLCCPTINTGTWSDTVHIPFSRCPYTNYGSNPCSDPAPRSIIELVDCDDLITPIGDVFAFGGDISGVQGDGGTGGASAGHTSDSPYCAYNYTGVISGVNPQNLVGTFGGSAGVVTNFYNAGAIGGSAQINGSASVKTSGLISATGRGIMSGQASYSVSGIVIPLGTASLGGLASVVTNFFVSVPTGKLTFNGLASVTITGKVNPLGKTALSGLATVTSTAGYQATGKLIFSGIADVVQGAGGGG